MNAELEKVFLLNPPEHSGTFSYRKCDPPQVKLESVENFINVCRICAAITDLVIPIFEGEGKQNNLAEKIQLHLPVQVTAEDALPQQVCFQCASTVLAWHELVQCCVQADAALRTKHQVLQARALQEVREPGTSSDLNANPASEAEQPKICEQNFKLIESILVDYSNMLEMNERDSELRYVCQPCKERCSSAAEAARHLLARHPLDAADVALAAHFIEQSVTFEEQLLSPAPSPPPAPPPPLPSHGCPFCAQVFSLPGRLLTHLNAHSAVRVRDTLECCLCDLRFQQRKDFLQHLKCSHPREQVNHDGPICRACGLLAEDQDTLRRHVIEAHGASEESSRPAKPVNRTNQKYVPVPCAVCGRTFSNKYNMAVHLRRHAGVAREPQWACAACPRRFRSAASHARHVALAHEGRLLFPCARCGERCPTAAARRLHERLHSGAAPYACSLCGKAFRAKNSLARHLDMHRDLRPHPCPLCARAFRRRAHLRYHLATHARRNATTAAASAII